MNSRIKFIIICLANFATGLSSGICVLAPLACWILWRKDDDEDVADYARRRLNTAISWLIYSVIAVLIWNYLSMLIGMGLMAAIALGWIYYFALDMMRAAQGDPSYEFPLTFDFISRPTED